MLALEVSKLQKPKKLVFFFVFQHPKPKNQTPFRGNQKKPKKLQGNQRIIFHFFFPETNNSVSKHCFLGFWFLGGSLSEVTQLQKPKTLEENVGLGSQQAPETNKTYRKKSFL